MLYWRGLLLLIILFGSGCSYFEEPRWAMLGDDAGKAYFMDREAVQRLANGTYRFPVKVQLYLEDKTHTFDDNHDTDLVLFVETNCDNKLWVEAERGSMDQSGKVLFRIVDTLASAMVVQPGTFQAAAYDYLCRNEPIVAFHNH